MSIQPVRFPQPDRFFISGKTTAFGIGCFPGISGMSFGKDGVLYVVERGNHLVRAISSDGIVSTLAGNGSSGYSDGDLLLAQFHQPRSIVYDDGILKGHPVLLRSDGVGKIIRLIDLQEETVSTFAGTYTIGQTFAKDGPANDAVFAYPDDIIVREDGVVFATDRFADAIRMISSGTDIQRRTVSTYAGTGPGPNFRPVNIAAKQLMVQPNGMAFGSDGAIYFADEGNHQVRRIRETDGIPIVEFVAGDRWDKNAAYADGPP
ncbi:MAG: hypothetical protein AAF206_05725 [Bacteroidota bacterium]